MKTDRLEEGIATLKDKLKEVEKKKEWLRNLGIRRGLEEEGYFESWAGRILEPSEIEEAFPIGEFTGIKKWDWEALHTLSETVDREEQRLKEALARNEETLAKVQSEAWQRDEQALEEAFQTVTASYPKDSILPIRAQNALRRANISNCSQLKKAVKADQIKAVRSVGEKISAFIQEVQQVAEQKASP